MRKKEKKEVKLTAKEIFNLFSRYLMLVILGLFGIKLIYTIFTPLTIYPSYWLLKIFYPSIILDKITLLVDGYSIILIEACIAGAAYYLLLILNLATPMKAKTRAKSIVFMLASFLFLNIIRIVVFSSLFLSGFSYFDITHKAVWYLGSTVLVVAIWFFSVYLFKIKSIPAWTDFKTILSFYKRGRK